MNNKEKGNLGELIALRYLIKNGAKILEKNYRIKTGEIDIIAKIEDELVFIEVKSRSSTRYGYPAEAVNYKKINKISNVARYFMLINNFNDVPIRFDVIEIYFNEKKINHIINAF